MNPITAKEHTRKTKKQANPLVVCSVTPLCAASNSDMFFFCAQALCALGHQVYALAIGDAEYQEKCFRMHMQYPKQFKIFEANNANLEHILSKSDVAFFSHIPPKNLLKNILVKALVPVIPETKELKNYEPINESGNAFLYNNISQWHMLEALFRAVENHNFSYDWKMIRRNIRRLKL